MLSKKLCFVVLLAFGLRTPICANSLSAQPPIELTGTHGKFDFIKVDSSQRRLLACHTGNGTLDLIDLDSRRLLKSVPTGAAQGVAIDPINHRYYVSVSKPPQLAIVDSRSLEITGFVPLDGPADLVACQPGSRRVFVCDDAAPRLWVIDPLKKKCVGTIVLPGGGLEDLGFDEGILYLCLKEVSRMVAIDPQTEAIKSTWPTPLTDKPHGQAIISAHRVLVAGGAGKLGLFALKSGMPLAFAEIAPRVDEIAYDPVRGRCFCASGTGVISVVAVRDGKLTAEGSVSSAPGAHSVAVDEKTHAVWIVFAGADQKAYAQSFLEN